MKKIITLLFATASVAAYAQPRLITQAIVTTKTTIISPEGDEAIVQSSGGPGGEQMRVMRFGGDSETKTTTWLKNDQLKTLSESEMSVSTIYRDNSKKLTTTIMEMMGKKTGFYTTDADQEEMRKRIDSMMQSRSENVMSNLEGNNIKETNIEYVDETKKISGVVCKKAFIISTRGNGKKDSTLVWYNPEVKLEGLTQPGGGSAGFGGFGAATSTTSGLNAMHNLNGFPMQYERKMGRGRVMTVLVTKLVLDKSIDDKEFVIPKDIEVKSMKEMQSGQGGGMQIRMRGQ